ncbi:MAG: PilZ domain-containing protein [Desulfobacteraceae bacterium]|nr:MAG: PilZ domain-containing protein [Desulfobacteraceae bacterium]
MDYIQKTKETTQPADSSQNALRIIDTDLDALGKPPVIQNEKSIKKKALVNQLNHIHFKNETIRINFKHIRDGHAISFYATPQPTFGIRLVCLWQELPDVSHLLTTYKFHNFIVINHQNITTVHAELRGISNKGICLTLPEKSTQTTSRKIKRYPCENLDAQLIQNGIIFLGALIDFSANSFKIQIKSSPTESFQWINTKDNLNLILSNGKGTIYSGQCHIIKQQGCSGRKTIILQPVHETIQRFNPQVFRSKRLALTPSPDIFFTHPLSHTFINLKIIDLSGSGLSVEDDENSAVLLPGMIIPSMTLNFAGSFNFHCKAQVVYRKLVETDSQKPVVKCGIAFLDMNPEDHMRLLSLLHQTVNKNFYICNEVDMDDLWTFFFASGFLYPRKYAFIHESKQKIKTTYERLYTKNSNIARHFTWQKKGEILGHLSMLRFYQNTWLIQHLAAIASKDQLRIGIEILNQIGSYAYDCHRLYSSHMDYLICYFRPENQFPNHFFGGVARSIKNPKACSIDTFVYYHYRKSAITMPDLPEDWTLTTPGYTDLTAFENYYENRSGGLMLDALDLIPEDEEMTQRHDLSSEYSKIELKRERRLYALKHNNQLRAVFMLNVSNFAVNLSDLTNCISVFVVDPENLPAAILTAAVSSLSEHYKEKKFPVLLFPAEYATMHCLKYEKLYDLWTLNMQHTDDYFKNFNHLS